MARPKKTDDAEQLFSLKTSELLWMRDKFISGLSNLESGVHELRRAYISHFNTLLPDGHPGRLSLPFFTSFDSAAPGPLGALPSAADGAAAAGGDPAPATEANVKKKRKPHDPNAPKRALTSYFLFMQHNKPEIKAANPAWDAKAVAEESERRWTNISEADKQKYEYMYQVDLARYYKQKEAYEAGEPVPEIDADQATRLYNEHLASGVPFKGRKGKKFEGFAPHATDAEGSTDEEDGAGAAAAAPVVEESAPPKAKRQKKDSAAATNGKGAAAGGKPPTKKQQAAAAAAAASNSNIAPAPPAPMSSSATGGAPIKSPEVSKKKGGRKSKGGAGAEEPVPIAPMMGGGGNVEEASPKKEKKNRKRKSAAE